MIQIFVGAIETQPTYSASARFTSNRNKFLNTNCTLQVTQVFNNRAPCCKIARAHERCHSLPCQTQQHLKHRVLFRAESVLNHNALVLYVAKRSHLVLLEQGEFLPLRLLTPCYSALRTTQPGRLSPTNYPSLLFVPFSSLPDRYRS